MQILRKEVDESLPKQILSTLLQHDIDTNQSDRYALLMDAPSFSTVEGAIMVAEDKHKWASLIRELDLTRIERYCLRILVY